MSVTYGFYNSKNYDRRYDSIQMSSIFDGIIRDGVLQHVGSALMVTQNQEPSMTIIVGIGRCWFNHTWTLNDAPLPLVVPPSELFLNRIDAVVIEVDSRENVRQNDIKIVKGTPDNEPVPPTMIKTDDRWQYPLAYVYVEKEATLIRQANITNMVGTEETPFVTAPLEKMSIDALIAKWEDEWKVVYEDMLATSENWKDMWDEWFTQYTTEYTKAMADYRAGEELKMKQWWIDLDTWEKQQKKDLDTWMTNQKKELTDWTDDQHKAWFAWWDSLKLVLNQNVAAQLAIRVLDLEKRADGFDEFRDDLSRDNAVYSNIADSNNDIILDRDGDPIQGKVIFVSK